jgi:hypothetical protein
MIIYLPAIWEVVMARRQINLEDFDRMGIDPDTGQLFWDGEAVVTALVFQVNTAAEWAVVIAIVAGSVAACGVAIMQAIEFNRRRREARRETGNGSGAA